LRTGRATASTGKNQWLWRSARYLAAARLSIAMLSAALPAHAFGKQSTATLQDGAITVEAVPITHFEKAQPARTQFGKLEWRGGLILSSPSSFFGGWSGLTIDRDGSRILGVSDTGVWLTGRVTYDLAKPTGITEARLGALRGPGGQPFKVKRDQDSEGVALISGTLSRGEVLVSFEQNHRIMRFPVTATGVGSATESLAVPPETKQLSPNKSLESVCTLQAGPAKGAILTFAERFPSKDRHHVGWMRPPLLGRAAVHNAQAALVQSAKAKTPANETTQAVWTPLSVSSIDGYDLTDCAGLPDGDILLLERRFRVSYGDPLTGPKTRIRRLTQAELTSGGMISGETIFEGGTQFDIDNMEGIAVHTDAKGATVLTLISDDNFNTYLQRTVLLQFALTDGKAAPSPAQAAEPGPVSVPK
jgi:hypothetical protein